MNNTLLNNSIDSNHLKTTQPIIECQNLSKQFQSGKNHVSILNNIHFKVQPGEQIAIIGPSGSGKSTLLHLLGGLDKPSQGSVFIQGVCLSKINASQRGQLRNQHLGFVYQFHHLLPEFNALENVMMPLLIRGDTPTHAKENACEVLSQIGLEKRVKHRPSTLSGGERQRCAIARALVTKPACLLADEPTGNLDPSTAGAVYESMLKINQALKTSLLIVTHDHGIARRMNRIFRLDEEGLQEQQALEY